MRKFDVLIVGGGIAGLTAANYLEKETSMSIGLLEATDRVGGRVKTDVVDGYRLDHGFQLFLTAYPEAKALLDYKALRLKPFKAGALIYKKDGSCIEFNDPLKNPSKILKSIFTDLGSWPDKYKLFCFRRKLLQQKISDIFRKKEIPTSDIMLLHGLSKELEDGFLRPFLSGIFLESRLQSSKRMFDFIYKMYSEGQAVIPEKGMEQIPLQLLEKLKTTEILCNQKVKQIDKVHQTVTTDSGEQIAYGKCILATQANEIVKQYKEDIKKDFQSTITVYFSADKAPYRQPTLGLYGEKHGYVNNFSVMSNVSKHYAPKGKALISVSVVNMPLQLLDIVDVVKTDLSYIFGDEVYDWQHLKTFEIQYALPCQRHVVHDRELSDYKLGDNLYVAGDHMLYGSINAAMKTGREVAACIVEDA